MVSYDWLVTETEAWPLASQVAYKLGTVRLAQASSGFLADDTRKLADKLEEWLRPRARGMTLEILRQIRDGAWFGPKEREVPLARYLIRLAKRYLEPQGHRFVLKQRYGTGASEQAARWRWLTYLLPEDLLVAALSVSERLEPLGEQVHLVTPHLEQILNEQNVAETHLHVGAAIPFPLLWTALLITLAEDPPSKKDLDRGGPPPFDDGDVFLGKLLSAAVARLLMASFLELRERQRDLSFELFCCHPSGGLAQIARRIPWQEHLASGDHSKSAVHLKIEGMLAFLGWKDGPPLLQPWQVLYRKLVASPAFSARRASSHQGIAELDPLVAWLGPSGRGPLPETRFTARALAYLMREGRSDQLFEHIFWQYQRVRCLTFRHLVEEPGTGGLDWFSRHYQRISALRKGLEHTIYRQALETDGVSVRLRALEARTAPPKDWREVYGEIQRLAEQTADLGRENHWTEERPEVALIFHFIKEREDSDYKCLHSDPLPGGVFGCRYGRWYYSRLRQAMALETALERDPEILLLLRGLDIANFELAVPTWTCLPLFYRVRRASIRAAEKLARYRPEWAVPPLRITCHLGEDFVRLVQGLRRIHEPIEFGLLTTGSRIGHAVALGLNPELWASVCSTLPQTAGERLEDLLWELDRYGKGDIPPSATGRLEYVRAEIARLSHQIYGPSCSIDNLLEARRRLHSPERLAELGYPYVRRQDWRSRDDSPDGLLWKYLTDCTVFERGQDTVEVRVDDLEVAFLHAAQQWLRQCLGRLEITVESNPSSNLLIGELRSLDEHPAFRLLPLTSQEPKAPPVMLSINVDDPITFASHLADEYAHVYFALTRRGVSSQEALAWLCQVREHGWRSRFTLSASRFEENLQRFNARKWDSASEGRAGQRPSGSRPPQRPRPEPPG